MINEIRGRIANYFMDLSNTKYIEIGINEKKLPGVHRAMSLNNFIFIFTLYSDISGLCEYVTYCSYG